jgi:hypothetical protein
MTSRRKGNLHASSSNIHYMPFSSRKQDTVTSADGQRTPTGFASIVPLIAITGQVALPYDLAVNDDGGLDFAWRPSQTREDTLADPVVWATIRRGSSPHNTGWIVGSCIEVRGTTPKGLSGARSATQPCATSWAAAPRRLGAGSWPQGEPAA